jgi:hypothetical protein
MRRTVDTVFWTRQFSPRSEIEMRKPQEKRDVVTQIDAVWFNSRLVKTYFNTHLGAALLLT